MELEGVFPMFFARFAGGANSLQLGVLWVKKSGIFFRLEPANAHLKKREAPKKSGDNMYLEPKWPLFLQVNP